METKELIEEKDFSGNSSSTVFVKKDKKVKRTFEFKLRAVQIHLQDKLPAKDAFKKACEEFNTEPSGCMTNYSTSYMWDYKKEVKKKSLTDEKVANFLKENNISL